MGKNLSTMQETRVLSLSWEDTLEKEMATHCSILAWEISWTGEPGGHSPWSHNVRHQSATEHACTQSPEAEATLPPHSD